MNSIDDLVLGTVKFLTFTAALVAAYGLALKWLG